MITTRAISVGTTAAKSGTAIKMLFMTKTTQAIIVAAVTTTAVLTTQTVWHHYRAPDSSRTSRSVQAPLTPQQAKEAKQTAKDFFEALGKGDWNTVAKYWPSDAPKGRGVDDIFTDQLKGYLGGLEIVSLGTPYREGPHQVLVPYEVRSKDGNTQTNNLRVGQDRDGQWHFEGGF
jgi:hypothetical protein